MYSFELDETSPNQNFSTTVDGVDFDITLNTANDLLFATVKVNGKIVSNGCRCIPNTWIVPYMAYLPSKCGNFKFLTRDEVYPRYSDFNTSCILVYYSSEEISNLK